MLSKMDKKRRKEEITAVLAIVALYVFFHIVGIGCPIKFITGVSCMGCGMTRAWGALLHLDVRKAFYYHPLFWIPPLWVLIFLYKDKFSIKIYKIIIFTMCMLFVIIYLLRMCDQSDSIVVFEPYNSILMRRYKK